MHFEIKNCIIVEIFSFNKGFFMKNEAMNNRNIVEKIIFLEGSIKSLSVKMNVTTQAVGLWKKKGFFPLEHMPAVLDNYSEHVQPIELINAYRDYRQKHPNIKKKH